MRNRLDLQIELENLSDENFISSYGENYIVIKNQKYIKNIIISELKIYENIKDEQFYDYNYVKERINENKVGKNIFLLFGTGKKIEFLPNKILEFLVASKISYEVMTSISAIKTYNVLLSQGRSTVAFLKLNI